MGEEEQGFTVRDRRTFSADGEEKTHNEPEEQDTQAADPSPPPSEEPVQESEGFDQPLPPVDFSGFVLSLSHAAMMHLGQIPDPVSGEARADLTLARHTIDTLAMIKDKTQGNLEEEEQRLIDNALGQLQMAFVHLSSQPNQKE